MTDLAAIRDALTDEDEIAHGEAWNPVTSDLMGICAYCNADWPCRTQRGIDRLLAYLADTPSVEPLDAGSPMEFAVWGLRSEFVRAAPPALVARLAVWRLLRGSDEEYERVFGDTPSVEPPCEHEWEDGPDDETAWYCPKCGTTEHPGEGIHEDDVLAAEYDALHPSVEPPINVGRLRKALDLCGIGLAEGGHPASDWTDALAAEYAALLPTRASDS